jgi:hypothetical protein
VEVTALASDADITAGKLWAVVITSDGARAQGAGLVAKVSVTAPTPPLADKELAARIDAAVRAEPRVPQALPPPTPLMPDAVSVARIVSAKIPNGKPSASAVGGKIVRSSTAIPPFVPHAPATPVKAPTSANANNYGGVPAEPVTGRTYVPVFAVDVSDDDGSHACTTPACAIKAGDVVTFTLGPGMDAVGHEVHFVFFEPPHDYAVSVLEWKDDVHKVAVQMPHLGPDVFDKQGAIFIGTASGKASSVFVGFKYDPTVTLFLPLDAKIFPPPATVYSSVPAPGTATSPGYDLGGPIDNATRWVTMRGGAASLSGRDTFFTGVTLKNGWIVKRVESQGWASAAVPTLQASHAVADVKPNTPTATFAVDWTYDAATTLSYGVGLKVSGREGTLPW